MDFDDWTTEISVFLQKVDPAVAQRSSTQAAQTDQELLSKLAILEKQYTELQVVVQTSRRPAPLPTPVFLPPLEVASAAPLEVAPALWKVGEEWRRSLGSPQSLFPCWGL